MHEQHRNYVDGENSSVVSTKLWYTPLVSRLTSRMHSTETISDMVLPTTKKTTFLRALTTLSYTEYLYYKSLLTLLLAITSTFLISHQTFQITNPPHTATAHMKIVNTISTEAAAKSPAITILALTKMMMTSNSSLVTLSALSFRKNHHPP